MMFKSIKKLFCKKVRGIYISDEFTNIVYRTEYLEDMIVHIKGCGYYNPTNNSIHFESMNEWKALSADDFGKLIHDPILTLVHGVVYFRIPKNVKLFLKPVDK